MKIVNRQKTKDRTRHEQKIAPQDLCNVIEVSGITYRIFSSAYKDTGFQTWGISIETCIFGAIDHTIISDISTDFNFVKKLQLALADGFVTPFSAIEVVENYIVENG